MVPNSPTKFEWRSTWGLHRSDNLYSFLGLDTKGNYWSARAHVEENVKAKCKYERKAEKFLRMEAPVRRSERIMKK